MGTKPVRVALDVDGVLADIINVWLNRYNKKSRGKMLSIDSICRWDFWKELGYDEHRFYAELAECWDEWYNVPLTEPNMPIYVSKLKDIAERVDIVSAQIAKDHVIRWLNYNGIKYDGYVSVAMGRDKAKLDYDIFIDDSPINALSIAGMGKHVLLYDQPWNKHVCNNSKIVRIKSLRDAIEILNSV
jgi:5'(3')-deoxyribonucleotidase